MKITKIESFEDWSTFIIYSTVGEFRTWMEENDKSDADHTDLTEESTKLILGMCTKIVKDYHYIHVIWINEIFKATPIQRIATIAHEATHMVDNLELFICNDMEDKSWSARIPRELRARIVETIVATGTKMIVGEIPDNKAESQTSPA